MYLDNRLFLDDIRDPKEVFKFVHKSLFVTLNFTTVRNFDEFIWFILDKWVPSFVTFDHDLAPEHYTPEEYWSDYDKSKEYQEQKYKEYTEKTWLDCAKWLVDYCNDNDKPFPRYYVHSQNPIWRDWIEQYIQWNANHLLI